MKTGYLAIETHADHRGLTRFLLSDEQPDPSPSGDPAKRIQYIARFNDGEAGLMHTHEILKRRLLDPDAHLYRAPLESAVAAVESLDLRHRRIYLDPDLGEEAEREIARLADQNRRHQRRKDAFFRTIGYIALGLLLFNLIFVAFA